MSLEKLYLKKRKELVLITMLIGSLLWTNSTQASPKHNFLRGLQNISFEVTSDSLVEFLEQSRLHKDGEVVGEVLWNRRKGVSISLSGSSSLKISSGLQEVLKGIFLEKARFIWKRDYHKIKKPYVLKEKSGGWLIYEDVSVSQSVNKISVLETEELIKIIEKKAIGTSILELKYEKQKWSRRGYVLISSKRSVYEGGQNREVLTRFEYSKYARGRWLPSSMSIRSVDWTVSNSGEKISRELNESIHFRNYKFY